MTNLDNLIATAHQLRSPGGCPWDAEQTHESLVQYLLEETYELIDAIETKDAAAIREELGDVLYQVVFHSDLAASGSLGEKFDIQDVAAQMEAKMISRHPHVFGDAATKEQFKAETGDDVMVNWDDHKKREKPERESVLDGIPKSMPALALANKVLGKADKMGLLDEENGPLAIDSEEQLGTLLLTIVTIARAAGFDSERALRTAVRDLMSDIRKIEVLEASDAGIIAREE
ncbi:MAG: MazG family protein [Rhodoluna sp.]|nr:MazG family protein [Rhodoluna sp.]